MTRGLGLRAVCAGEGLAYLDGVEAGGERGGGEVLVDGVLCEVAGQDERGELER
jgi:hypothetical protein